jgi:3-oxoacyl-[acyl-carrier-protein] synthase I
MNGSAFITIERTGLVSAVGLNAPASCAALRAKISNPSETRFKGPDGEWLMAHQVPLPQPWRGLTRLSKMAAMAIEEALSHVPRSEWGKLPLLLCVAERERPGRMAGLDEQLFLLIQQELGVSFAAHSMVITQGRVAVAVAMAQARALIAQGQARRVLVAAADSLLSWPTLAPYLQQQRLLTPSNANGFMPGEGAGALLIGGGAASAGQLVCSGVGFGIEKAHIHSESPLRADGLTDAVKAALADAGCQMQDLDFRITDLSGEQFYFKEAVLAATRTMRVLKAEFDLWHPAECIGEAGAVAGAAILALAAAACHKGYAKGSRILCHMANDAGQRAALTLQYQATR